MKKARTGFSGWILAALFFTGWLNATGQPGEITRKSYATRAPLLFDFYVKELRNTDADSVKLLQKIDSIATAARRANDNDLLAETQLMRIHYYYYRDHYPRSFVLQSLDTLRKTAIRKNLKWLQARVESLSALTCFEKGYNYELGFVFFRQMDELVSKLSIDYFPDKQICYYQMGYAYYEFSEYENAIRYFSAALRETPAYSDFNFGIQIQNSLGMCYQKKGVYDSSDHHFRKALLLARTDTRVFEIWEGIISGNLGYNRFLTRNYAEAAPLLQKDVAIAEKYGDRGLAVGSLVPLAEIALAQNRLAEAEALAGKARLYTSQSGQYRRLEKVYPLLAKIAALRGQGQLSGAYFDSSLVVKDSLSRKLNAMQMARAQQRVDLEKHTAELALLQSEKRVKILERNILLVAISLLFALSVYIFYRQRKRVLAKQEALNRAQHDLDDATLKLETFTRNISEKNKLIETLVQQANGQQTDAIVQLKQKTILTDDEWKNFQALFEKVHDGFLQRLKEKIPGLSPAETRFMTLSKLGLGHKEMAATLGVGPEAIRQYRSRIRRKLNLAEEGTLEELTRSI